MNTFLVLGGNEKVVLSWIRFQSQNAWEGPTSNLQSFRCLALGNSLLFFKSAISLWALTIFNYSRQTKYEMKSYYILKTLFKENTKRCWFVDKDYMINLFYVNKIILIYIYI